MSITKIFAAVHRLHRAYNFIIYRWNIRLIASVFGFVGIILVNFHNPKCILSPSDYCQRISNYETCVAIYITLRVLFTLLIVFADIMQVYFCFALFSYYEKLYEKNNRSGRLISNDGNDEVSAPTYGAVSDQSIT
ncbi:hypothetical protein RhiirA5_398823 [Rhizophagus irregularis]|uniref:Uncharacterized protein n=1 Tax=Rhizophagus irregularis TaxID=588596 RepID=A0A2I1E8J4_9GLOM|nr:hypothetical protein RhiirA5_398823 [Rhizophagus irregularis]PKC63577.1 hypothetical protein RhiirA1_443290 [Rhizophagus irregularis]PKY18454.1 hypothetical protein RhiirB3_468571 [Rhizophagus irregularis]